MQICAWRKTIRIQIVICTEVCMMKTNKNMDSHSYRDVHDENPYKNNMDSYLYKDVHDKNRYKNNMDIHSYKDVHDENP